MRKKYFLPIVLIWKDKSINVQGADVALVLGIYIRKGRTLTIDGVNPLKRFEMKFAGPMKIHGDIRLAKTAQEVSIDELRSHCNCESDWSEYPGARPGCSVHSDVRGAAGGSGVDSLPETNDQTNEEGKENQEGKR